MRHKAHRKLVQAPGHTFSDVDGKVLSCINLASLRDLEQQLNTTLDPLRFRANVYFDNAEPWAELDWADKELKLGTAKVRGFRLIKCCAAPNVNPKTAARDLEIPQVMLKVYEHRYTGLYVQVIEDGELTIGDELSVL
jgi:uncharacterized protein YcbX